MSRFLLIIMFAITSAFAISAWAQDDAVDDAATEPAPEAADEVTDEDLDEFELSQTEDHTEEDDDVFKPTDVVSFQQSVPFPVDI